MIEQGSDYDDRVDGSRKAKAKRSYSHQQSPRENRRYGSVEDEQISSPPYKRFRQDDREPERDRSYVRGRGRDIERDWRMRLDHDQHSRFESPDGSPKSSGRQGSLDLLPSRLHNKGNELLRWDGDNDGRLSYWDDGYESPEPRSLTYKLDSSPNDDDYPEMQRFPKSSIHTFSSIPVRMKSRPSAIGFWSDGNLEREIKAIFSDADPDWVREMASFDVDTFLDQMDDFIAARESPRSD